MKSKFFNLAFLSGWFGFWIGATANSIGQSCDGGIYDWRLPVNMGVLLVVTILWSIRVGRDWK